MMRLLDVLALSVCAIALSGCAISPTATPTPQTGLALRGNVHGGQQPIVGAHVYLLAANTTGYGGSGIAPSSTNASLSLLTSAYNTAPDISGNYFVTTDATGSFSITGDYTCTAGQQVYLYALGGNPGAGPNPASGLLAILGNCPGPSFSSSTFVWMNEVSTIAAAYAFAGFASDATHVSSSGTTLAQTGIANAFANAANLVQLSIGAALTTTPAGNGTVPQTTINTLANILTACVNSTGPTSSACSTLFTNARSGGSTGMTATETATAAINIAHNPGTNIKTLFAVPAPTAAFAPALPTTPAPNDFTLGIQFTGGGLYYPLTIAIDALGDVWIVNNEGNSLSKFSSAGVALSPSGGYTGGGLSDPTGIALDGLGDAWIANGAVAHTSISKFSNAGVAISPSAGYTGGGLNSPLPMAIDALGDAWTVNYQGGVSEFTNAGAAISPTNGYTGGGLYTSFSMAIDGSGAAWAANYLINTGRPGSISKFSSAGVALSPSTGFTGGGLDGSSPPSIAIDASGNAWVANVTPDSVSKFSNAGTALSPSAGYTGGGLNSPKSIAIDGAGNAWIANDYALMVVGFPPVFLPAGSVSEFSGAGVALSPSTGFTSEGLSLPQAIAIDGSGNAWVPNNYNFSVSELIGVATPVITPIAAGLPLLPTANGSSNLGTRP